MIMKHATAEDAIKILNLQKLAYMSEAEIYNDYALPPLVQTLEEMVTDFENHVFLKALVYRRVVGSVRAHMNQETCQVGRLIVHPDLQNRGIGARLMNEIESCFSKAKRFELFTGHKSERNIHLYRKLGYQVFRSERVNENLELVYLEKLNKTT